MPSSATITAFHTFTANTKARATQVNNNFSVYRGHNIPVEVLTATSANMTYDQGSTEYRWRNTYGGTIDLDANTTTATVISAKINAVEKFKVTTAGFVSNNASPMGFTTTAAIGQMGYNVLATTTYSILTTTAQDLAGSTITISTAGRAIWYELINSGVARGELLAFSNTTTGQGAALISLMNAGVTIASSGFGTNVKDTSTAGPNEVFIPASSIRFLVNPGTLTSQAYYLAARTLNSNTIVTLTNVAVLSYEIR